MVRDLSRMCALPVPSSREGDAELSGYAAFANLQYGSAGLNDGQEATLVRRFE
jgi:hypothetical protein